MVGGIKFVPPLMCSSANVSPNRSGGAATVPLSSKASFARKASLNIRPFSFSLQESYSAAILYCQPKNELHLILPKSSLHRLAVFRQRLGMSLKG